MSELAKAGPEGMKDPYVPPEIIPKSRQRSRRTHTSHQIAAMTEEGKMFSLFLTHVSISTATSENFLTYDTILAYAICLVVYLSNCLSDCVRMLARTPSTSSFTYFPLLLLHTLNLLLLSTFNLLLRTRALSWLHSLA
jgi:hypothetical protein